MKKRNRFFTWFVVAGILIASIEAGYLYLNRERIFGSTDSEPEIVVATSTNFFVRRLDGVAVDSPEAATSSVIAIMIDNHPNARPQSGLAAARVVYEVPVEGGLTRFLALFDSREEVAKVGPVRSARPYFLDWLSEYGNTSYWHSGGSQDALDLIKTYKVWDVNEFYFGRYFWRSSERSAPHNLYTASERWQKFVSSTAHQEPEWRGWSFDPNLSESFTATEVSQLQIKYENNYLVSWTYDKNANRYVRRQNDKITADESGNWYEAETVVVQVVEVEVIDNEGRKKITTIGKGDARVLRNGKMIRGYWQKDTRTNRTRFYDAGGREIPLQPGKVWVQLVPASTPMEVSS